MARQILVMALACLLLIANARWTEQQANDWYSKIKWSAGVNYIPAYADNQIEMWDQLNLNEIDKELRWAIDIGFTKFRVFLHVAPYIKNSTDFIQKVFSFLAIAKGKGAGVILVLFDDCWRNTWASGKQPEPIPGVHNSQWVQCPGDMDISQDILKKYVVDIVGAFKSSTTVVMWDLYNEVGNSNRFTKSLELTKKIFGWARSANPSQPLTSGHWSDGLQFMSINQFILNESDVITFHAYCNEKCTENAITAMKKYNRPIICTEYMARTAHSKFITHLPIFKSQNVWAINWGFVFGRTQTYYPWGSPEGAPVPKIWFHDVVHPDGTPFDQNQTMFIKEITK